MAAIGGEADMNDVATMGLQLLNLLFSDLQ